MESLIFILVLVIIIISNLVRVQKKLKASAPENQEEKPQTGRWKQDLKNVWEQVKKEMEGPAGDAQTRDPGGRRPSGWEDLMPAQEPSAERAEPTPARPETPSVSRPRHEPVRAGRGQTLIESRSQEGRTPEARVGKTERRAIAPPLKGPDEPAKHRPHRLALSREKVRHAVIWYEVLGPPMSLRDPEREMWL